MNVSSGSYIEGHQIFRVTGDEKRQNKMNTQMQLKTESCWALHIKRIYFEM